jgi:hypothetical protein
MKHPPLIAVLAAACSMVVLPATGSAAGTVAKAAPASYPASFGTGSPADASGNRVCPPEGCLGLQPAPSQLLPVRPSPFGSVSEQARHAVTAGDAKSPRRRHARVGLGAQRRPCSLLVRCAG